MAGTTAGLNPDNEIRERPRATTRHITLDIKLIFALAFAVFIVGPALLGSALPIYPLMSVGDALDLLTPLVLIPLYWRLWRTSSASLPDEKATLAFLALASLWTLGQGMHLAANSIGHLVSPAADDRLARLVYFYDETLSHYLWHFGAFGLTGLIMVRAWRGEWSRSETHQVQGAAAAVIYGLTFCLITLEGQTWPLGLPFAAAAGIVPWLVARRRRFEQPALGFFAWAHLLALGVLLAWWLYWGAMVEPCDVVGC